MNNPLEIPPNQTPKPVETEVLPVQPPEPETGVMPGETRVEATTPVPETLTDAEVMKKLSVPVPYTPEEMAAAKERWDNDYIEPETTPPHSNEQEQKEREGLENLKKVVELMDEFELRYPLQELHAFAPTSLAELVEHPVRKPANIALVHIRKAMALSPLEKMPELNDRYRRLSRAVGIYNATEKRLDHTR